MQTLLDYWMTLHRALSSLISFMISCKKHKVINITNSQYGNHTNKVPVKQRLGIFYFIIFNTNKTNYMESNYRWHFYWFWCDWWTGITKRNTRKMHGCSFHCWIIFLDTGYHLVMPKAPGCQVGVIHQLITGRIPDAKLKCTSSHAVLNWILYLAFKKRNSQNVNHIRWNLKCTKA